MKRFKTILLLVLVITIALPAFAADKIDSKIRFNDLYGEVSIRPNDEDDDAYENATLDTVIYEDDRIKTEEDSGAILGLEDMSTYVIKPESTLIIHTEDGNVSKIEMLAGAIWGNFKKMSEGKSLEVEMSQCVCSINGTIMKFESENGVNEATCIRGSCIIYDLLRKEVIAKITAGQQAIVDGKGVKIIEIVIEEVEKDLKEQLDKSNEKQSIKQLIDQLNNQTGQINTGKKTLDTAIEFIKKAIENDNLSENELNNYETNYQKYLKEGQRFVGIFVEVNSTISVLSKKIEDKSNSEVVVTEEEKKDAYQAIQNAKSAINDFGQALDLLIEYGAKLELKLGNTDPLTKYQKEKTEEIKDSLNSIDSDLDGIIKEISDDSSYNDFKDAAEKCEALLRDMKKIEEGLTVDNIGKENLDAVQKVYSALYTKIEKAMNDFSSVPVVTDSLIKSMNDIDGNLGTYSSSVRSFINKYKSITNSSSVVKSEYVTDVTRALSSYDRMRRNYTKANRMYNETVKNFKNSSYKSAEFKEVEAYWDRIDEAMRELDNEATELSSILDEVKTELNSLLEAK